MGKRLERPRILRRGVAPASLGWQRPLALEEAETLQWGARGSRWHPCQGFSDPRTQPCLVMADRACATFPCTGWGQSSQRSRSGRPGLHEGLSALHPGLKVSPSSWPAPGPDSSPLTLMALLSLSVAPGVPLSILGTRWPSKLTVTAGMWLSWPTSSLGRLMGPDCCTKGLSCGSQTVGRRE